MIKVVFFAALREQLDCSELTLNEASINSIAELKVHLATRGDNWQQAFTNNSLLTAINHDLVDNNTTLKADDEVAFFPPVTGG